jgi:Flp pilus assembly protein TadG
MTRQKLLISNERGFALIYIAITMVTLLLFTGLAIDSGRAYVVKAQLTKAVDGAALGAARMLNSGNPKDEATKIFHQNFPAGYMGTEPAPDPAAAGDFFALRTVTASGVNIVTVTATVTMPTTFMKLANQNEVVVSATGEATRRMVDLSLVLDVSSSIGSRWPAVRDAARTFIDSFDPVGDRLSLTTYGNGARVIDQMRASRGFAKATLINDVPSSLPGGSTAMVEGLYRGWDELRSVPRGSQSGLRVLVLFTDGASNSVPGFYDSTTARGLRTYDFPKNFPDPDGQTWNNPAVQGLYDTDTGAVSTPSFFVQGPSGSTTWNNTCAQGASGYACLNASVPYLPVASAHTHRRSSGIPTSFPLESGTLRVNGVAQNSIRGLRNKNGTTNKYPAEVFNINNAARNLLEIIADATRNDDGDYPIRIYTIGMGDLVQYNLGTIPEKPEDILKRIANDIRSPDYNSAQLEGKFYFARTEADVSPAFQALQNQIIRLTK